MANGQVQDHPHTHGRTAIEDMRPKIEAHLVGSDTPEVVDMIDARPMTTDPHLLHHQEEIDDRTGVTAQMRVKVIFLHHLVRVDTLYQTSLATAAQREANSGEAALQLAMSTYQATLKVRDGHESLMTGSDVVRATPEILEKVRQMIEEIGVQPTVTEIATEDDQATPETLVGTEETAGHGREVPSVGIGTATTGTTTSIGGVSHHSKIILEALSTFIYCGERCTWSPLAKWRIIGNTSPVLSIRGVSGQRTWMLDLNPALGVCSISLASYIHVGIRAAY